MSSTGRPTRSAANRSSTPNARSQVKTPVKASVPIASTAAAAAESPDKEPLRYRQVNILTCARGVFQMTRICMGTLAVYMASEYKWTPEDKGEVLAAFAAGYAITQVPGGLGADKFGGKPLIMLGLLSSGGALFAMTSVADLGVKPLWWLLWGMGFLQGPTYPAQQVATRKWATDNIKAYASAMGGAGSTGGSLMAAGLSASLASRIGWRMTAYFFGGFTIFFALIVQIFGESEPSWVAKPVAKADSKESSPGLGTKLRAWFSILLAIPTLALFSCHFTHNFVRYAMTSWMPTYYLEVLKVSPEAVGLHLTIPEFVGLFFTLLAGSQGKKLKVWFPEPASRRLAVTLAFGGGFVGLIAASKVFEPALVTACLCLVMGLSALQGLGFGANYLDISVNSTGLVAGVGNTVATVGSYVSPIFASRFLSKDAPQGQEAWQQFFTAFAMANLVGWVLYVPLCSCTPVDAVKDDKKTK